MFFKDSFIPNVQTVEIEVKQAQLEGLSILHLSDLHIDKKTSLKKISKLVEIINDTYVDFIVLTGDIIDCKVEFIKEQLLELKKIKSKVYYISGNHDLYYGLENLKEIFDSFGFIFMDNTFLSIKYKKSNIYLGGLSDRFSKFFNIKRDEKNIVNYLKVNQPSIFLAHQPKDYKFAQYAKSSLFLCGHTHGGQIFPFHFLVKLVQPFISGLHYKNNMAIYINKGLGTWGLKYRFLANAEITIIKLRRK